MAWIFSNTISTLPYGYYLRVDIIADCGTTGTLSPTNGGYVANIGAIAAGIDEQSGQYTPGAVPLELRNVDNVFTTNVFNADIGTVEVRIWVSYDATATWSCLFFGFLQTETYDWKHVHSTETRNLTISCQATHAFLSLKDIPVDFITYPITTGNITCSTSLTATDEKGALLSVGWPGTPGKVVVLPINVEYVPLKQVLDACVQRMPFIAGATAPTITIDTSAVQAAAYNDVTTATYTFNDLYIHYTSAYAQTSGFPVSHFMTEAASGKASAYEAKNYQELLKRWCEWLLLYPVARMSIVTVPSPGYAVTVTFVPRFLPSASIPAVAGAPTTEYEKAFRPQLWFDSLKASTYGLPLESATATQYSAKAFEARNWFATSPVIGYDPYLFFEAAMGTATSGTLEMNRTIAAQQLFVKTGASTVRNAHKFKHIAAQSFFEASQIGYYGVQHSIYNLITQYNPAFRAGAQYGRKGLEVRYKTLRGTTVADLDLFRKVTVSSVDYIITNISRNVVKNETTLTLLEAA